ncbi:XRE family transcriptional regulator [Comamonas testosteroni]|uniref:XRE family transcriptional regulator n=1 Tax=Comamonas testosteroni TaxID=285 RepID=A0A373FCW7_COMTE|nr:XRE family transcriptional regulator [Comamonas testosteroni]
MGGAGLTHAAAAVLVHANTRSWQKWEAGEREMHPAFWELFCLKTGRSNTGHNTAARTLK